jgi:hypothetical protein
VHLFYYYSAYFGERTSLMNHAAPPTEVIVTVTVGPQQRPQQNDTSGTMEMHHGEDLESAGAPTSMVPRIQLDRQSLTWQRVPLACTSAMPPPPRSGAASVVVANKLYMFGVRIES